MSTPPVTRVFLAGPTASGKSALAIALAERLGGEIISVDSMQVYRGADIGTAKPSSAERARVPHHLLDIAAPTEEFDVAQWVQGAQQVEQEIRARGRVAIYCGGTGLYFKALLEGLGDAPPRNAALRATLEATPLDELLQELELRDRSTFERIDRANPRRVIRAMEVIRLTGKPFAEQRANWLKTLPIPHAYGIAHPAGCLQRRIDVRVEQMFVEGLVEETRALMAQGMSRTLGQAIGYRQVVEHLEGARSLLDTIELVKIRTRQYAKRQGTWFRGQMQLEWLRAGENDPVAEIAGKIMEGSGETMAGE